MKENIEVNKEIKKQHKFKIGEPCVLDPDLPCVGCKDCLMCDLNPEKYCDNCGKCLDSYNTDEKGFVSIKVDKVVKEEGSTDAKNDVSLDDLYKMYGLDDDDE